ncbi:MULTISPECIES: bifunctional 3-phenylpropionate/cinnamic acid dioxygenase ferredoxin subunit [Actinomycetes]|uniref:Bifunctional 3-phenylpropionate/cinnamic acid dioxygenase ferredoxin subunit n=2 Tax=Actinomycetes TaxID=1760 RepID=A0ABP6LZX0_9MICC|nr:MULTISPECIES: bifunctional 3-phenylpropionate/cinnamic acid dioxygenase ferredoxin subunit [unclassified Nesterenkonia]MDS2172963.1 bifunctional 3-phenylpropionate/cinnamic acid dioxygenase ferredoxin subunit [Nesterenkonia sp. CL21]OSM42272.1 bifunctional 3-phenylpropionate/cinnamic acid dioxygenase ferredoxin subunit [Nesterenkonia sp. PF2B19]
MPQSPDADVVRTPLDLGPMDSLEEGEVMRVDAEDSGYEADIAVVHAEDGGFYALDDECSHESVSLSDGFVEDCTLECPMHASAFCLRTGTPETPPAMTPVRTHLVTIEGGHIMLHPGTPRPEAAEG